MWRGETEDEVKVLQVVTDTNRRGAQLFAMDLGYELESRGHSVLTVALKQGSHSSPLDVQVLGPNRYSFSTLRALRRLMRTADVTIGHGSDTALACAVGKFGTDSPYVYRQISSARYWCNTASRRLRSKITMRFPDFVVALSTSDRVELGQVLGIVPERVAVIPNAVNERKFEPASPAEKQALRSRFQIPDGFRVAVFLGALVEEKGCSTAIGAVMRTERSILLVAGSGVYQDSLVAEAAGSDRVRFVGTVERTREILAVADVLLLPSWTESQPAVLMESGMMGVPSIATNVGAIPEIVLDGATGMVVPARSVDETAEALQRLFSDDALRRNMGMAARAHCQANFSIAKSADRWVTLLASLCRAASASDEAWG